MLGKLKVGVFKKKSFGVYISFREIFQAFDCISHELYPAKLHGCGFNLSAFKVPESCTTLIWVTYQESLPVKSFCHRNEIVSFLGPKNWSITPKSLKWKIL